MSLDFGTVQVDRLIIHEIPRRIAEQPGALRLTGEESTLDQSDRNFFSERIKNSLAKSSYEVAFDPESISPVPGLISRVLSKDSAGTDNFVSISQTIARHLYGCQTGVNPPGVLAIAQVKLANKASIAILKLEKEEGMQFEPEESDDGLIRCNVKQLSNLMLTGGKVFKVGVFSKEAEDSLITGYVSDKQSDTEVAKFFLDKFLGCYLLASSEIITKKFFKICQDFINNSVNDPELKARYEIALLSMIQDNQNTINPVDFADYHLELDDRQNFINFLSDNQVPINSFEKNTNSIQNLIKAMHLTFNNSNVSISVSGNPSSFKDINIQKIDGNKVLVSFEAELEKVGKNNGSTRMGNSKK